MTDHRVLTGWSLFSLDPDKPWKERQQSITSTEQLFSTIDELQREYVPTEDESPSVRLRSPTGDTMRIGLGGEEWLLIYLPQNGDVVLSLGDPYAEGTRVFMLPEWSEFTRDCLLPAETARRVLLSWIETGSVSPEMNPLLRSAGMHGSHTPEDPSDS